MRFKVILEEDKEMGGYVVSCPALLGCHSQGDTKKEALNNIKEAIQACLESLSEDVLKEAFSRPSSQVVEVVV
ncbi:MAG: type II toxin-antitoxin system HicB family antitoxin [Candidatus Hydrothermarchaeales archaeon]